mmetsp:Transcript_10600/g.27807  ORF Transcript_10600/g.27807 Transcript_10600/m.27807 type:complete len:337 (+) Transcript_10600:1286-2296(+)
MRDMSAVAATKRKIASCRLSASSCSIAAGFGASYTEGTSKTSRAISKSPTAKKCRNASDRICSLQKWSGALSSASVAKIATDSSAWTASNARAMLTRAQNSRNGPFSALSMLSTLRSVRVSSSFAPLPISSRHFSKSAAADLATDASSSSSARKSEQNAPQNCEDAGRNSMVRGTTCPSALNSRCLKRNSMRSADGCSRLRISTTARSRLVMPKSIILVTMFEIGSDLLFWDSCDASSSVMLGNSPDPASSHAAAYWIAANGASHRTASASSGGASSTSAATLASKSGGRHSSGNAGLSTETNSRRITRSDPSGPNASARPGMSSITDIRMARPMT